MLRRGRRLYSADITLEINSLGGSYNGDSSHGRCFRPVTDPETHQTDLKRLVQHVALNQSGWWEQAIERLILACAYTTGPSGRNEICESVRHAAGAEGPSEQITRGLERLLEAGSLVEHNHIILLSESMKETLRANDDQTRDSEDRVRSKFENAAKEHGLADRADDLWRTLETDLILPIVRNLGARLYELLTASAEIRRNDIAAHMDDFLESHGHEIRKFFFEFIDPNDDDIRAFVLRRLNAQYAIDAAALPRNALDRLANQIAAPSRVRILLDTNFLFSVIDLHDNPGNDEATSLLHLVEQVSPRIQLQLYALPTTVEEARTVLSDVMFRMRGFRGQPNLAEAARRTNSLGLVGRYFEAVSASGGTLSPDDFFGPYESNLLSVLRSKNVELYNAQLDELHLDQEVIDDVHDQAEFQRQYRQRGEKSYEANLHDMVLWHFAHRERQRQPSVSSPLDVTIWVATLDFGLLSFDRHKRRSNRADPPVCLDPTSLIQLFQFWVPSSSELDAALVGSIRGPLLFLNFDTESEQVTLRILAQLSRYEGAGDLSPDLALEILTNAALRDRITKSESREGHDDEIVGDELLETIDRLYEEREVARESALRLDREASRVPTLREQISREESLRTSAERERNSAEEALERAEKAVLELREMVPTRDERILELETTNRELRSLVDVDNERRHDRRRIIRYAVSTLVSILLTIVGGGIAISRVISGPWGWFAAVGVSILIMLFGTEVSLKGTYLADSRFAKRVSSIRKAWWAFGIAVVASLVGGLMGSGDG